MGRETYLFLTTIAQHDSIYATADVRVDCRLVASLEFLEHLKSGLVDCLIVRETGSTEHQTLELLLDVAIVLAEGPS
jgi:hypothetical protein